MKIGIVGDSASLGKLFGIARQPDPLHEGNFINWQETAFAHQQGGSSSCEVFTSTLLDNSSNLRTASSWESAIDLDLVVFSFSALSGRCFVDDPAFAPAFAWADGYFRSRQASPQVAVLLVGGNVPQSSVEGLITNLVDGNTYLEALTQVGRLRWWDSTQPALIDDGGHARGDQQLELSEHMRHALASFLQRPAVARLSRGGSPGGGGVRREARNQFATGFLVCCFALLLLLLAPILFPSLEGTFVGWFLPMHSTHLADLQARASGLSDNAARLATEREQLRERADTLKAQNLVLEDRLQELAKTVDDLRVERQNLVDRLAKTRARIDFLSTQNAACLAFQAELEGVEGK